MPVRCLHLHQYLHFRVVPFMLLAPIPMVIVGSMSGGPMSVGPSQSAREAALFTTSSLGASALIVPFFLQHIEKVLYRSEEEP